MVDIKAIIKWLIGLGISISGLVELLIQLGDHIRNHSKKDLNDLQDKILEKAKKSSENLINNECECYVVPMNKEIKGYISLFISCMSEIKSEDFRNLKISSFDIDIKENKVKIYVNKEKY